MSTNGPQRRRLLGALAIAGATLLVGHAGVAAADGPPSPRLEIKTPPPGTVTNDPTPRFSGTAAEGELGELTPFDPVVFVRIYAGTEAVGPVIETVETPEFEGERWSGVTKDPLEPGQYTAVAEQHQSPGVHNDFSDPVTFRIDTSAPVPTLSSPADGSSSSNSSETVAGTAGAEPGDLPAITVQLFAGATVEGQAPLESLTVPTSTAGWSATFGGLGPGTYTTRAEQADEAGNVGRTAPATFKVTLPQAPPDAPPAASFKWFPAVPQVGHAVTFVSSSTDAASPISAFAWSLAGTGAFNPGKALLTTTFTTPGLHTVRLRVTAADGLSSIAVNTVRVTRSPLTLMQPFPVVRIAGALTSTGVKLALLTAQAPLGARVRVTCRGRGCPTASETRIAGSSSSKHHPAATLIAFRRFQRALTAGVILEIRISKPGRIGKYTRFAIRHGKLPERVDSCLGPAGVATMTCPSS
jgi:hypothetical protein